MKLNNRGWGTQELIFSCCIIFILLLVIVINVNRLYRSLEDSLSTNTSNVTKKKNNTNNSNNNNTYNNTNDNYEYNNDETDTTTNNNYDLGEMDLEYYRNSEARLEEATRKYMIDNDLYISTEGQMVDIATLINANYIPAIHDLNDNSECAAYSFISMEGDRIVIKPYISCTGYTTEGY